MALVTATLSATVGTAASTKRDASKRLAPSVGTGASVNNGVFRTISASTVAVPSIPKRPNRTIGASVGTVGSSQELPGREFDAVVGTAASNSIGGVAPQITDFAASEKVIAVAFDLFLSLRNPDPSEFVLTINGTSTAITSTLVAGRYLYLFVAAVIPFGDTVHLVYTPGTLYGSNSKPVASFDITMSSSTVDDSVPQLTTVGGFNSVTH
jgi:hypothetical protein